MPPKRRKEIEDPNNTWDMQFMAAVLAGNKDEAENLIQKGAKVDHVVKAGTPDEPTITSPWHAVAKKGDVAMMQYLAVDHQCDVNLQMENGHTILHWAVASENVDVLVKLIELMKTTVPHLSAAVPDATGTSATLLAMQRGSVEMARALLKVDPNSYNFRELVDGTLTSCQRACKTGDATLVETLLSVGDQLHQRDLKGNTLLHLAFAHRPVIELLLDRGLSINQRNSRGQTVLLQIAELRPVEGIDDITYLLSKGADATLTDNVGMSALHYAVVNGAQPLVKKLMDSGAVDINIRDKYFSTALHWAAASTNATTFETLFSGKVEPDVNCVDLNGDTPLHRACYRGATAATQILLHKEATDPNIVNHAGRTPLHVAAVRGHGDCVQLLLKRNELEAPVTTGKKPDAKKGKGVVQEIKKTEIDVEDKDGLTAMQLAVQAGYTDLVKLLLAAGAAVQRSSAAHTTLMHEAVYLGNVGVTRAIIEAGGQVALVDDEDRVPLHVAVARGNLEMVRLLVQHGSSLSQQEMTRGETPLHVAARLKFTSIAVHLLENGANPNTRDTRVATPLHYACEHGDDRLVAALLDAGAHPSATDSVGCTPLHIACEARSLECVRLLVSSGSHVEARDGRGWRPLHSAASVGGTDIAKFLLTTGGAMPNACDKSERTPMFVAAEFGHPNVAKVLVASWRGLLLQNGKEPNGENGDDVDVGGEGDGDARRHTPDSADANSEVPTATLNDTPLPREETAMVSSLNEA
eukprot:PhM_4_TR14179/c0_g1_i1/m.47486/K10380/ANK; ankyrin